MRVTRETLNLIKVGAWDPSEVITQGSEDKPSPSTEVTQPSQTAEPVPRSFRITQEHLAKFSFTKGCPKCEALRRGDEHKTVHHNRECRYIIETEMSRVDLLSKKLSDIEERTNGYLARRVEASDKERVDAEMAAPGSATVTGDEPRAAVDTLTAAGTGEVSLHRLPRSSESLVCTWIECSHDKGSWAEVQEEEQRERGGGVLRPLQALTP